jgi:hypothetical protein
MKNCPDAGSCSCGCHFCRYGAHECAGNGGQLPGHYSGCHKGCSPPPVPEPRDEHQSRRRSGRPQTFARRRVW